MAFDSALGLMLAEIVCENYEMKILEDHTNSLQKDVCKIKEINTINKLIMQYT